MVGSYTSLNGRFLITILTFLPAKSESVNPRSVAIERIVFGQDIPRPAPTTPRALDTRKPNYATISRFHNRFFATLTTNIPKRETKETA